MTNVEKIQKQIDEAMAKSSPRERVEAFLSIEASGRGAPALRERQERLRARMGRPVTGFVSTKSREEVGRYEADKRQTVGRGLAGLLQDFGRSWNRKVYKLWTSQYADVYHGRGGECENWDYYAKSCKYPLRYKYAGIYIDWEARSVVMTTYKDKRIEIPLPSHFLSCPKRIIFGDALLQGDAYGVRNAKKRNGCTVVRRYVVGVGDKYRQVGYAVEYKPGAWEHADTLTEIDDEVEHKRQVQAAHDRRMTLLNRSNRKLERAARLVARVCDFEIEYSNARAVGFCQAGIQAFQRRTGLGDTVRKSDLLKFRELDPTRIDRLVTDRAAEIAATLV